MSTEAEDRAAKEASYRENARPPAELQKFPRTFYYANTIELFERLAHYGLYIGLAIYLRKVVGMSDIEVGFTLGNFRFVGSMAPIPCGAIADKITFKKSLMVAFAGYAVAYGTILFFPQKGLVVGALLLAAVSGGFMKPVITGTVVRTSPPGRQTEGFSVFYRTVNAGSVVGKTLAYGVRRLMHIRFVAATSAIASLISLAIATFLYEEPKDDLTEKGEAAPKPSFGDLMRGYWDALKDLRFTAFLLIFSGYYFMIEQFYMTFPQYMTRHIDDKAPLEIITLINPATIAVAGGFITKTTSRLMKGYPPIATNILGITIAAVSMLVMGALPSIPGACLSAAIFAVAEMTFTPKFYDQLGSLAPKGKAGMYMGLAFVPSAIGAWLGGQVSGPLIKLYLPEKGERNPFLIWAIYAGLGITCAAAMAVFAKLTSRPVAVDAKSPE
jgi:proton-dependent oligopeptide transporter, POT family